MMQRIAGSAITALLVIAVIALAGWFVFASSTGATLITFRTGSMAPTMPQGALAVSLPVTADEIRVGDVITVQRGSGELPVTHRIIEIRDAPHGAHSGARELVMQGDDNEHPDMLPYTVTDARRVVFALPVLGTALMLAQSPIGMGVMTLLAAALVVWAFWPGGRDEDGDGGEDRARRPAKAELGARHSARAADGGRHAARERAG